jgi:hypothetical protein
VASQLPGEIPKPQPSFTFFTLLSQAVVKKVWPRKLLKVKILVQYFFLFSLTSPIHGFLPDSLQGGLETEQTQAGHVNVKEASKCLITREIILHAPL